MRFFGDSHEPAALVLSEFNVEVLALNLQLSRYDDIVHDCCWGRDTDTFNTVLPWDETKVFFKRIFLTATNFEPRK